MSKIKNNYFPIIWVSIFGSLVFFHAAMMVVSLATYKLSNESLFLLIWHIIIGAGYIFTLVYTYRKRETLSKNKINFLIIAGFLLYLFLSSSGCYFAGAGMH